MSNVVETVDAGPAGVCERGDDRRRVRRHNLTAEEATEAYRLAEWCVQEYGHCADPRFHAEVPVVAHRLPEPVRRTVNAARLDDRLHGLVLAGNRIEEDRLERTPSNWREAETPGSRAPAFLLVLYAALLGDPIGWLQQQDGRIVTDVVPMAGQETSLLSSSSHKALGWHTEDAFSPYRGDYIGLLCLRNPDRTPTSLSYVDTSGLGAEVFDVLRQPRFHVRADDSHEGTADAALPAVPLLDGPPDAPVLRVDRDYTSAVDGDPVAAAALAELIEHLDRNLYPLALVPGDVCFIDNRNAVHGRYPFVPRYDGLDRWLKRVNVAADLRRSRPGRAAATSRLIG